MPDSVLRSAGRSAAWVSLGSWISLLGGMASLVVLTRLLTPSDYGIFGMALVALAIPETIACNSLNESLIQRADLKPGHRSSILLLSLGLAALFFVLIFLASPIIANWFSTPDLIPVLRVLALGLLFGAITAVPAGLLQRAMNHRAIAIVDTLGVIAACIVGIGVAVATGSVWALVGMEIARRFVRMVAFLWFAKWRPSFQTSVQDLRDLASYNLATIGTKLVASAEKMVPQALVGLMLGASALGMFNIALRILDQGRQALVSPLAAVALPVAARLQSDALQLREALDGAIRLSSLLAFPAFIGAIVVAPLAVPFAFGEQWAPAVPVIQIALLIGLRMPVSAFNAGVLKGVGRPDQFLKAGLAGLIVTLVLTPVAASIGLEAVMAALVVQQLVVWLFGALMVRSAIGFGIRRQVTAGASAFVASVFMGGAVYLAMIMAPSNAGDALVLPVLIAIGIVAYLAGLATLAPAMAMQCLRILQALIRREKVDVATLLTHANGQPRLTSQASAV